MNIIVYGIAEPAVLAVAARYGLGVRRDFAAFGESDAIVILPPLTDDSLRLRLVTDMERCGGRIDAVVAAQCETASTVCCCAPQGKLFTVAPGDGEHAAEELSRIVESLAGLICAHEGL